MADGRPAARGRPDEPDTTGRTTEENDVTADTGAAAPGAKDTADAAAGTRAGADVQAGTAARRIGAGPGRLLLWLYGIFTVAALSRSAVQISMKFQHAPLAYTLSAVAGVVYAVILVALAKGGESARRIAMVCCSAELLGVLTVGTLTIADSSAFADSTVWSYYGVDYLLIPLALPVSGLMWLRRAAPGRTDAPHAAGDIDAGNATGADGTGARA